MARYPSALRDIFPLFFALAAASLVSLVLFIISSASAHAQGNSVTGYFVVSGGMENKEATPDDNSGSNAQNAAANSSNSTHGSGAGMAPFTGSATIGDGSKDDQSPGLIETLFVRIISFFRGLF